MLLEPKCVVYRSSAASCGLNHKLDRYELHEYTGGIGGRCESKLCGAVAH